MEYLIITKDPPFLEHGAFYTNWLPEEIDWTKVLMIVNNYKKEYLQYDRDWTDIEEDHL